MLYVISVPVSMVEGFRMPYTCFLLLQVEERERAVSTRGTVRKFHELNKALLTSCLGCANY